MYMTTIYHKKINYGDSRCRPGGPPVLTASQPGAARSESTVTNNGGPGHWHATRAQSQMKMLRRVKNEIFTFDFDSEITLVGCTLER